VSVRRDVFSTDSGEATLTWPDDLGAEELHLFLEWLQLQQRKIHREGVAAECRASAAQEVPPEEEGVVSA
jgi:hypothetical protein